MATVAATAVLLLSTVLVWAMIGGDDKPDITTDIPEQPDSNPDDGTDNGVPSDDDTDGGDQSTDGDDQSDGSGDDETAGDDQPDDTGEDDTTSEPPYCQPIDILPFVIQVAPEMPGHSAHGLIAKVLVAQGFFEAGNIENCLHILTAFYNQMRASFGSDHMTEGGAEMLYDAYAAVVECLGGTPQPEIP